MELLIQVNTSNTVEGREPLILEISDMLRAKLDRFASRLTRIEVSLRDENGPRTASDENRSKSSRWPGLRCVGAVRGGRI